MLLPSAVIGMGVGLILGMDCNKEVTDAIVYEFLELSLLQLRFAALLFPSRFRGLEVSPDFLAYRCYVNEL